MSAGVPIIVSGGAWPAHPGFSAPGVSAPGLSTPGLSARVAPATTHRTLPGSTPLPLMGGARLSLPAAQSPLTASPAASHVSASPSASRPATPPRRSTLPLSPTPSPVTASPRAPTLLTASSPSKASPLSCRSRPVETEEEAEVRRIFERIDVDKNGVVSELELISALEKDKAIAEMLGFDAVDTSNEDCFDAVDALFKEVTGGKQRMKLCELQEYLQKNKQVATPMAGGRREIFRLMDADMSGSVSKLEMVEAVKKHAKVAAFVLPRVTNPQAGDEHVFDAISTVFEAISAGKRRFDWVDFERHFQRSASSSPRVRAPVDRPSVRVFIIGPGFGMQMNPKQGQSILAAGYNVRWCHDVPNPEQANFPVQPYLEQIRRQIVEFQPDIVAAASKGGAYVTGLWAQGYWRGPTLLLNAHPTCKKIPEGVTLVLAHGSNDEIYKVPRADLESLIATAEENKAFLYYTANSGRLASGQLSRMGDKHNMESLLKHEVLPRMLDALLCPDGPEVHMIRTWRERVTAERLEAEAWLGYTPEKLRRHWQSHHGRGRDAQQLFDVPPDSEEFKKVAAVFRAAPREAPAYVLSPQAAWDRSRILRLQRVENGLQADGSTGPYYSSLRSSVEAQNVHFEPGVHSVWTFHGTADPSALESIVSNPVAGFQPLASGTRGASLWGLGTYFAREAKYVADGGFCGQPAADGSRRMLMCLLSSGLPCLGGPEQKGVLPFRRAPHRYHCSVDSLSSPEIFIAQHAGAAMPAYVITFAA